MDINLLINDLNRELSSAFDNFDGVYMYGSRIRGNYEPDSDYDFIILFKSIYSMKMENKLAGIIIKIELKYDIFIDYHPMTMKELKKNPVFYDQVVNKGIYYEAAA